MEGWISLYRKFINWEWYSDTITVRVFLHLLLTANYKEKKWEGIVIKRGQKFTSYQNIFKEIGDKKISIQNIRTAFSHLKSTGEITWQVTHNGMLITIEKYDLYQIQKEQLTDQSTDQLTSDQQTANMQLTTNNNINKYNNINKLINTAENVFEFYQNNIGPLNSINAKVLNDYVKKMEPELVKNAIVIASKNNVYKMNYIEGILQEWEKKGYKTLADIEKEKIPKKEQIPKKNIEEEIEKLKQMQEERRKNEREVFFGTN